MMYRKSARTMYQQGVTLVEILLVMGLLSIFMVVLVTVFTATISSQSQTEAYSAVTSDGRFILERLNYDIASSSAITTPTSLGASGSSLVMTVGAATYTYALSGNNLQLTDATGSANLNSDGTIVSTVTFQRLGNTGGKDTIRYSFTLTSVATPHSGPTSQTFTSTVERR